MSSQTGEASIPLHETPLAGVTTVVDKKAPVLFGALTIALLVIVLLAGESGDTTFRLGNLHTDSYAEMLLSDALLDPLEESFAAGAPMCSDCAFESWCGADPVFHHATQGSYVGHKAWSAFHRRNKGIFTLLLSRYESDTRARELFRCWANR